MLLILASLHPFPDRLHVPQYSRRGRAWWPAHVLESIDNLPGAYLIYLDSEAFPEKGVFWTRG